MPPLREVSLWIPFSKVDDETRTVTGVATSEALDSQGQIMDWEGTKEAAKGYSEWLNVREMHDPRKAAGVGLSLELDDVKKQAILTSKCVDDQAWEKIKAGVYKGYSVGGHIIALVKEMAKVDGKDREVERVTKWGWNESSYVDRPANPTALLSIAKRDATDGSGDSLGDPNGDGEDGEPLNVDADGGDGDQGEVLDSDTGLIVPAIPEIDAEPDNDHTNSGNYPADVGLAAKTGAMRKADDPAVEQAQMAAARQLIAGVRALVVSELQEADSEVWDVQSLLTAWQCIEDFLWSEAYEGVDDLLDDLLDAPDVIELCAKRGIDKASIAAMAKRKKESPMNTEERAQLTKLSESITALAQRVEEIGGPIAKVDFGTFAKAEALDALGERLTKVEARTDTTRLPQLAGVAVTKGGLGASEETPAFAKARLADLDARIAKSNDPFERERLGQERFIVSARNHFE